MVCRIGDINMNIKSAKYYQAEIDETPSSITAVINNRTMNVPMDPNNRHYSAILECAKEDGNEIQAAE